ncbi:hypothetical protein GDO81_018307 [Engystomops pustulosus]|uniref:Uncharacterized protein n=1 Tax=Engystomops pustulosus TaxID=76066 RepID=A0AAV7AED8_ENGPU|nr:hypothetical protein GDO81_018307 [Engystomops pustulosus]
MPPLLKTLQPINLQEIKERSQERSVVRNVETRQQEDQRNSRSTLYHFKKKWTSISNYGMTGCPTIKWPPEGLIHKNLTKP